MRGGGIPLRRERSSVSQRPVHGGAGPGHGDLPGRAYRRDRPRPRWRGESFVPALVRRLPAAVFVHRLAARAHHRHPPARGGAAACPRRPARPGLARPLPHRPAHRGTQDFPLHPPCLGRAQRPHPAGWPGSPPTLSPALVPLTGPGSPSSDSTMTQQAGCCEPREPGLGSPQGTAHYGRLQAQLPGRPAGAAGNPTAGRASPRSPYFSAVLAACISPIDKMLSMRLLRRV